MLSIKDTKMLEEGVVCSYDPNVEYGTEEGKPSLCVHPVTNKLMVCKLSSADMGSGSLIDDPEKWGEFSTEAILPEHLKHIIADENGYPILDISATNSANPKSLVTKAELLTLDNTTIFDVKIMTDGAFIFIRVDGEYLTKSPDIKIYINESNSIPTSVSASHYTPTSALFKVHRDAGFHINDFPIKAVVSYGDGISRGKVGVDISQAPLSLFKPIDTVHSLTLDTANFLDNNRAIERLALNNSLLPADITDKGARLTNVINNNRTTWAYTTLAGTSPLITTPAKRLLIGNDNRDNTKYGIISNVFHPPLDPTVTNNRRLGRFNTYKADGVRIGDYFNSFGGGDYLNNTVVPNSVARYLKFQTLEGEEYKGYDEQTIENGFSVINIYLRINGAIFVNTIGFMSHGVDYIITEEVVDGLTTVHVEIPNAEDEPYHLMCSTFVIGSRTTDALTVDISNEVKAFTPPAMRTAVLQTYKMLTGDVKKLTSWYIPRMESNDYSDAKLADAVTKITDYLPAGFLDDNSREFEDDTNTANGYLLGVESDWFIKTDRVIMGFSQVMYNRRKNNTHNWAGNDNKTIHIAYATARAGMASMDYSKPKDGVVATTNYKNNSVERVPNMPYHFSVHDDRNADDDPSTGVTFTTIIIQTRNIQAPPTFINTTSNSVGYANMVGPVEFDKISPFTHIEDLSTISINIITKGMIQKDLARKLVILTLNSLLPGTAKLTNVAVEATPSVLNIPETNRSIDNALSDLAGGNLLNIPYSEVTTLGVVKGKDSNGEDVNIFDGVGSTVSLASGYNNSMNLNLKNSKPYLYAISNKYSGIDKVEYYKTITTTRGPITLSFARQFPGEKFGFKGKYLAGDVTATSGDLITAVSDSQCFYVKRKSASGAGVSNDLVMVFNSTPVVTVEVNADHNIQDTVYTMDKTLTAVNNIDLMFVSIYTDGNRDLTDGEMTIIMTKLANTARKPFSATFHGKIPVDKRTTTLLTDSLDSIVATIGDSNGDSSVTNASITLNPNGEHPAVVSITENGLNANTEYEGGSGCLTTSEVALDPISKGMFSRHSVSGSCYMAYYHEVPTGELTIGNYNYTMIEDSLSDRDDIQVYAAYQDVIETDCRGVALAIILSGDVAIDLPQNDKFVLGINLEEGSEETVDVLHIHVALEDGSLPTVNDIRSIVTMSLSKLE